MSSRSPSPSSLAVVAILTDSAASVDHTLEAVAAQNYEPAATFIVGRDSRTFAEALGFAWHDSLASLLEDIEPAVTHVWLVHAGAVPRPDALHALVFEAERVGAGVAGSKLLDIESPGRLVSVGLATDVFDVPYLGLDEDELDAGQYDVVRDVSAVGGASMLVRRDLLKGLRGPDPALPPEAAAIDLCQRARALGARVVVVPSSEVAVVAAPAAAQWLEEAGRIRAMLKVYSPLTLIWAIPLRFLIGLLEVLVAPFTGRWTLLIWLRSWLWNVWRLPSTLRRRRVARSSAVVGDAEQFRFQLRGSATLRRVGTDLLDAARARFPTEERSGVASLAQELRRPAFGVAIVALLFSLIATRQLWAGFPAGGFSLPLPPTGADTYGAYAGGWNPAGFGSTEQLPPFLGLAGLWQRLWLDNPDMAAGSLALLAFLGGIWGMARLLRTWSIGPVPGILAGVAFMAGPAARTIAGSGDVANLIGLAVVPWVGRAALAPLPRSWLARFGRLLTAGWLSAVLANLSPELLLLPLGLLVLRAALEPRNATAWIGAAVGAVGAAIGAILLRPWINNVDFVDYLRTGEAFWSPGTILAIALVVCAAGAILAAPSQLARVGLWGGLAAAIGTVLARTASEGGGAHLEALGLAAVAAGGAILVGVVLESLRHLPEVESLGRVVLAGSGLAAGVLVASALLVVGPGRGGLPADTLSDALRFTGASIDDDSAARVLLIGPADSLPGTSRSVRGAAYRVVSAPVPQLWEVELPEPGPADVALREVLSKLIDGTSFRVGEQLAEFGIRWVVEMGPTPLTSTFAGQLDVIPLDGLRRTAFLVDSVDAVRAQTATGDAWQRSGTGYMGRAADVVYVKEHADARWGSDAEPEDWAMTLDGSTGEVHFAPRPSRQQAQQSLLAGVVLVGLSAILRRRR